MAPESVMEVGHVDDRADLVGLRADLQLMMASRHREIVRKDDVLLAFETGEDRAPE